MITLVLSALLLGLFGSAHCVLMCGGIASTLVQIGRGPRIATPAFMYNVGRIASYAVLGALVGALGHAASFVSPVGPVLRLAAGLMLVFTGLYVAGMSRLAVVERIGSPLWRRVQPFAIRARSTVVMGMLWGLMPCGLVYAGFGLAVASGGIASGALVMAAFGLGTLPSMVTASLASLRIAPFLRSRAWVRRAAGAIVLCSGLVDVGFASAAIARPAKPACACHAHT
jgi:sulfite exporter TauE/SafE